jgi:hypothetical protein
MMKVMKASNKSLQDEKGVVAIFSVLIIMGILTLLSVGFSNITRQAQKRALDDQLNTQAFYAAESGVNRVMGIIDFLPIEKTDCDDPGGLALGAYSQIIDTTLDVSISCLLFDKQPSSFDFDYVPEGDPIVFDAYPAGFQDLYDITFAWDAPQPTPNDIPGAGTGYDINGSPIFPPDATWDNDIGVIRVDIVDVGDISRAAMATTSYTFFMYPATNVSPHLYNTVLPISSGTDQQGATLVTGCDDTIDPENLRCMGTVRLGIPIEHGIVRVSSYYNPVRFSMTNVSSQGLPVEFKSGQVVIDSTGRANDVYRRIRVRLPIDPDASYLAGLHTPFSIQSADSICKRIFGIPRNSTTDTPLNPACQLP